MTDDENMAAITHLLALFTWIVGPLIILAINDDSDFVDQNARNAINWQITYTVLMTVSLILTLVVVGVFLIPIVGLVNTIFCVIATIKAVDGETWDYPLTPDLV